MFKERTGVGPRRVHSVQGTSKKLSETGMKKASDLPRSRAEVALNAVFWRESKKSD